MQRAPRIEFLRFALLITLTIALAAVAFRINDHPSAHKGATAPHGARPGTAGPGAHAPGGTPSGTTPSVLPTSATRAPRPGAAQPGSAQPGSHPGSSGGPQQPILPVTGPAGTARLAALSLVLIGGGVLTIRLAGPRRRRRQTG